MVGKCSPIITPFCPFDPPVARTKTQCQKYFYLLTKIKLISKHKVQKFYILLEMIRRCFHKVQNKKKKKLTQAKTIRKLSAGREIWVAGFIQLIRYVC